MLKKKLWMMSFLLIFVLNLSHATYASAPVLRGTSSLSNPSLSCFSKYLLDPKFKVGETRQDRVRPWLQKPFFCWYFADMQKKFPLVPVSQLKAMLDAAVDHTHMDPSYMKTQAGGEAQIQRTYAFLNEFIDVVAPTFPAYYKPTSTIYRIAKSSELTPGLKALCAPTSGPSLPPGSKHVTKPVTSFEPITFTNILSWTQHNAYKSNELSKLLITYKDLENPEFDTLLVLNNLADDWVRNVANIAKISTFFYEKEAVTRSRLTVLPTKVDLTPLSLDYEKVIHGKYRIPELEEREKLITCTITMSIHPSSRLVSPPAVASGADAAELCPAHSEFEAMTSEFARSCPIESAPESKNDTKASNTFPS